MKINLLPRDKIKKGPVYIEQLFVAGGLIALTIIILMAVLVYFQSSVRALDKKIAETEKELEELKSKEVQIEEYKKANQTLDQKVGVIEQLKKRKSGPAKMLAEIADRLPEKMWITSLRTKGLALALEGVAIDNETIADFMTRLEASPEFENVELKVAQETRVEGLTLKKFSLTASILAMKDFAVKVDTKAKKGKKEKGKKGKKGK